MVLTVHNLDEDDNARTDLLGRIRPTIVEAKDQPDIYSMLELLGLITVGLDANANAST